MRPSGKVSAFMNQNPRKVAAFVSECLDYRRFEASDLLPYATRETLEELGLVGYQIDTFSSDYDDYWLAPVGASYSVAYALGAELEAANDLD